jgi:hypothetical protein
MSITVTSGNRSIGLFSIKDRDINLETYINASVGIRPVAKNTYRLSPNGVLLPVKE